jgi:hypothetical protein
MDFKLRRLLKITASKLIAMFKSVFLTNRNSGSEGGQAVAQARPDSANIGRTCETPIFTAIETSFFKEEGLSISARDE